MSKQNKTVEPKLRFPEFKDKGGWNVDMLGNKSISTFVKERTPLEQLQLESYISTENLLPDYAGVTTATRLPPTGSFTRFKKGDVLISNIRPYLKKVWFATRDGASSNDVIVIRAQSNVSNSFLIFLLKNDEFINYVMKGAKGVKMPRGDISLMKEYLVAFPGPEEQQKIADCLTSIDELVTAHSQKLDALEAHKKGLMQQLFPVEGETAPKLRFPGFTGDWFEAKLSQYIKLISGLHLAPEEYGNLASEDKIPYFTGPSGFTNDISEVSNWTSRNNNFASSGDTLLTVKGSGVGQTMFLELAKVAMGRQLMAVSSVPDLQRFIFYCLDLKKRYFEDLASGNMIPGLSRPDILTTRIFFPKDNNEGTMIADCLSSVDDLITGQIQKIESLKAHKKGLMQQLFPAKDEVSA